MLRKKVNHKNEIKHVEKTPYSVGMSNKRLFEIRKRRLEQEGKRWLAYNKQIIDYVSYDENLTRSQFIRSKRFFDFTFRMVYYNLYKPEKFRTDRNYHNKGFELLFYHPKYETVLRILWDPTLGKIYTADSLYVYKIRIVDKKNLEPILGFDEIEVKLVDFRQHVEYFSKTGLIVEQ